MVLNKKILFTLLLGTAGLAVILFPGCIRESGQPDPVVARVGRQVITVSEFRRNYEFGMPFLKKGADPKAAYLDYMIKEKILAKEGYRLGLDQTDQVKENEMVLLSELLIEELFDREIRQKIVVTPEEIRDAMIKSNVRWKFRYWFEPNLADAKNIHAAMKEQGYARVVAELLDSNPEIALKARDFESGYVTWMDIDPVILDAIKDLPQGAISDPVFYNGAYVIFQITGIQREAFTENAFREGAESIRQTLFYRKALAKVRRYVDALMTPKNVVTKGDAFQLLAAGIAEWRSSRKESRTDFADALQAATLNTPHLYELKENLDKTLMLFKDGHWTISEFLQQFDPAALKTAADDRYVFRSELNQRLALTLRDHFLAVEARKQGLHKSGRLQRSLQQWRDKWVYDESRKFFLRDVKVDSAKAYEYFLKNRKRYQYYRDREPAYANFRLEAWRDSYLETARTVLTAKIESLQQKYPIKIYDTVLDTISITASTASRWMSVQLFKSGSGRMAVPIVDPAWGL